MGVVSIVACSMISDDSSAEVTSGITGDCTWTLDGTKLTISGNGAIADYDYYSKPSPWGRSITEVVIENGAKIEHNTTLIGQTYIGKNCTIEPNSIIKDSVISDKCVVKCSYIEQSRISENMIVGPFEKIINKSN